MSYSSAFSPSFKANAFADPALLNANILDPGKISLDKIDLNAAANLDIGSSGFEMDSIMDGGDSGAWTFITAPEDISWDTSNAANRIDMFGTNNPPVVAGTRGMRDLTLGNALVEGFVRRVSVEDKVAALEKLMNYELNSTDGFVKVPVYQVKANDKTYGNGFFIIKDVKVKETMRDLKGNTTRAFVDISLMQVPEYQVNSGRDQASKPAAAAQASALPKADPNQLAAQRKKELDAKAKAAVDNNVGAKAGANAATPAKPSSSSAGVAGVDATKRIRLTPEQ